MRLVLIQNGLTVNLILYRRRAKPAASNSSRRRYNIWFDFLRSYALELLCLCSLKQRDDLFNCRNLRVDVYGTARMSRELIVVVLRKNLATELTTEIILGNEDPVVATERRIVHIPDNKDVVAVTAVSDSCCDTVRWYFFDFYYPSPSSIKGCDFESKIHKVFPPEKIW